MSTKDRRNRQHWAASQRQQARAAYAASRNYAKEDADKLAYLRHMAAMLATMPHMAATLKQVEAEIEHLSR